MCMGEGKIILENNKIDPNKKKGPQGVALGMGDPETRNVRDWSGLGTL